MSAIRCCASPKGIRTSLTPAASLLPVGMINAIASRGFMSSLINASPTLKSPRFEIGARLSGQVKSIADLSASERDEMYGLLSYYFANTSRPQFERDLAEKDWAIILCDTATSSV